MAVPTLPKEILVILAITVPSVIVLMIVALKMWHRKSYLKRNSRIAAPSRIRMSKRKSQTYDPKKRYDRKGSLPLGKKTKFSSFDDKDVDIDDGKEDTLQTSTTAPPPGLGYSYNFRSPIHLDVAQPCRKLSSSSFDTDEEELDEYVRKASCL